MRDGRLVIRLLTGLKRKIKGIVHDESASGKTVFIEPAEVVEANNRIRELEEMSVERLSVFWWNSPICCVLLFPRYCSLTNSLPR